MMKKIIGIILAAAMMLILAACSGGSKPGTSTTPYIPGNIGSGDTSVNSTKNSDAGTDVSGANAAETSVPAQNTMYLLTREERYNTDPGNPDNIGHVIETFEYETDGDFLIEYQYRWYDEAFNPVTERHYDSNKNLIFEYSLLAEDPYAGRDEYTYYETGVMKSKVIYYNSTVEKSYIYNENGDISEYRNYFSSGKLATYEEYLYDGQYLVLMTSYNNDDSIDFWHRYSHFAESGERLSEEVDESLIADREEEGRTEYAYDVAGNILSEVTYSSYGTIIRNNYTYDSHGNKLTKTLDGDESTYEYDYDKDGNILVQKRFDEGELASEIVTTYDDYGNILTIQIDSRTRTDLPFGNQNLMQKRVYTYEDIEVTEKAPS